MFTEYVQVLHRAHKGGRGSSYLPCDIYKTVSTIVTGYFYV